MRTRRLVVSGGLLVIALVASTVAHAADDPLQQWIMNLSDVSKSARVSAANQIATLEYRGAAAIPALGRALGDPEADVRRAAAHALGRIGPAVTKDPAAFTALTQTLTDRAWPVREAAAEAIGRLGHDAAITIPLLSNTLGDPESRVHRAAAHALSQMGQAGAVALVRALAHPSWWARDAAGETLQQAGGEATPMMIHTLMDRAERQEVRTAIANRLAGTGPEAASALIKILGDRQESVTMRAVAADALGSIGPPLAEQGHALQALTAALNDPEVLVRLAAAQALAKIQPSPEYEPGTPLDR